MAKQLFLILLEPGLILFSLQYRILLLLSFTTSL